MKRENSEWPTCGICEPSYFPAPRQWLSEHHEPSLETLAQRAESVADLQRDRVRTEHVNNSGT